MHADTCQKESFQSLERGLALLAQALARGTDALNPLEKEGALRRFEYCLDLSWKAAKDYLQESGLRIDPITPREVFRQAAAAGLLTDRQVWIDMLDHRNLLAHSYDGVVHDFMLLDALSETRATRAAIDQATAFLRAGLGTT